MADNIIHVFGHTTPDTDSISCAITMANLQNQIGREAQSNFKEKCSFYGSILFFKP